mmetsp:Transcript_74993/g.163723  ORF Transcript_74993/g.163723 Transcript_74993/m.163723 type:complete len:292 (-) Transcript_74993:530-1405(-)|eukprot:CAMPEP_0206464400 /NCGR_PEP_ID=MMETSP0324_2-20121206/27194_1 /ASSEMBLY_ACC=CAM_ASM_000836 /TAXON_ID=2866 /ORGANISM="Crypthecodinium cohnii, Strain Seligo" /LENGTH=291 /DNA_ID=CAMNT_0053937025 /DNA_START=31 /DNA_END=906 /DNA_ORIENTATION=+
MADAPVTPGTWFKTLYPDSVPQAALGAVLKWCDAAQTDYYHRHKALPQEAADLIERSVMRSNAVEFLVPYEKWAAIVTSRAMVHCNVHLVRVGNTSFALRIAVSSEEMVPLAIVETVMVAVSAQDFTKPVPVPNAELMKKNLRPAAVPAVHAPPTQKSRPDSAFLWKTQVRKSDCDILFHVNNAIYGNYMEDARFQAAEAGALPKDLARVEATEGFPHGALVEYLGQPHAGQSMTVAVWCDEATRTIYFEFFLDDGQVVCKASMVCGTAPVSTTANFVGSSLVRTPGSSKL